jgi:adenylate kinase family enzyme
MFLVDGFPRSAEHWQAWKQALGLNADRPTSVYIHCPDHVCRQRLARRDTGDAFLAALNERRFRQYHEHTVASVYQRYFDLPVSKQWC